MKLAVLAIGSLFWDDDSDARVAWRSSRLRRSAHIPVSVPIRYGRKSEGRENTYTMVISRLCMRSDYGMGVGLAIPCQERSRSEKNLIEEAEFLWAAEEKQCSPSGRIARDWGSVALLANPKSSIPTGVLDAWSKRVGREVEWGQISCTDSEKATVKRDGTLNVPWPLSTDSGAPAPFDLLLATANDPEIDKDAPRYPSVDTVAQAWLKNKNRRVDYFFKNLRSGIRTYQDGRIARRLLGDRERWTSSERKLLESAAASVGRIGA